MTTLPHPPGALPIRGMERIDQPASAATPAAWVWVSVRSISCPRDQASPFPPEHTMIDPELMTDVADDDGPTALFATLAVLILIFALGFGAGYLVAWL